MKKTICELFAGVGGFRLGFERQSKSWKTVWADQWEPGAAHQWAYECYMRHFGGGKTDATNILNEDIAAVDKTGIPDFNVLTGGFPCQDYSVARSLKDSRGIEGKKGVLWWQIRDILEMKRPAFVLLENVDRLLKSPATQRGRDFAVMLACFRDLGYGLEWRVVNAADYGAAQRRRRVFLFAWRKNTTWGANAVTGLANVKVWLTNVRNGGFMARTFPCEPIESTAAETLLPQDIGVVSESFSFPFESAGAMLDGHVSTMQVLPKTESVATLRTVLADTLNVSTNILVGERLEKFGYLKGAKRIERQAANGHRYVFSEGAIPFPDSLDVPSRTMLTSEGTVNRSTHVVADPATGKLRLLLPVEAERLQGFDDGWTEGMPERMRFFCMGNALVVTMVTRMAKTLSSIIAKEP
jgi:DNA (cytosine-5)-methyltransferase 1